MFFSALCRSDWQRESAKEVNEAETDRNQEPDPLLTLHRRRLPAWKTSFGNILDAAEVFFILILLSETAHIPAEVMLTHFFHHVSSHVQSMVCFIFTQQEPSVCLKDKSRSKRLKG